MDPELFSRIVDQAPDGILVVDEGGRIVYANRRAEPLFGYLPSELVGRPVEFLVPERFRGRHIGHQAAFHSRPSARPMGLGLELTALRRDGTELPVEISLSPLQTEAGTFVTAVVRDISERTALEDTRRRAEERYRLLAEQAQDIIFRIRLIPAPPRIEYMSPASRAITGYAPEDHYADPDLMTRMTDPAFQPAIEQLLVDPERVPSPLMLQMQRRDGSTIWLEQQFSIIRNAEGQPIAIEGIARDATARMLEEEERHYLRAQAELLDERERIARDLHDGVMQTLYGIGLNLVTLRGSIEERSPELVHDIDSSVQALNGAIADIRTYVMNLPVERANNEITALFAALAREFGDDLNISVDLGESIPSFSDAQRLVIFHIAREALSNTRKHSHATQVLLSMHADAEHVVLEVTDNGDGFDTTTDRGRDHMGLRNMHVRAEEVNGRMEIISAVGAGTTIRLTIPAVVPVAEDDELPQSPLG